MNVFPLFFSGGRDNSRENFHLLNWYIHIGTSTLGRYGYLLQYFKYAAQNLFKVHMKPQVATPKYSQPEHDILGNPQIF